MERIDLKPPESRWEKAERVAREADTILKLKALFLEKPGRTAAEALQMAMDAWKKSKS